MINEPVWHSSWNGVKIFPQRIISAVVCCLGFWLTSSFLLALACLLCAGMMVGSAIQDKD